MAGAKQPIWTCAYSGRRYVLDNVLGRGWVPRGIVDPGRTFATEEEIRFVLGMRGGNAQPRPTYRCPYTGRRFEIVRSGGGWRARQAWSPVRVYASRQQALYAISTRGGVKPCFSEHEVEVETKLLEPPYPSTCDDLGGSSDAAEMLTEELFK